MHIFGCKDKIQIQYDFLTECSQQQNSFEDTWGCFRFFVSECDLCEYIVDGVDYSYQDHLFWIVEWLCENLYYVLGYDPFPITVSGNNAIEMINNVDIRKLELLDAQNECEMLLLDQAKFDWSFRHGWFASRGGSILPLLFFRRLEAYIEISWDSTFWMEKGINFKYPVGCHLIQIEIFKNVILAFLKDYLKRWELNALKYEKPINCLSKWYDNLSILGFSRDSVESGDSG